MHTATQSKSEDSDEHLAVGEYQWVHPSRFSAVWQLIRDDKQIMTISAPKSFGRMVYCEYDGKTFSIKKGGVRHPGAELRSLSSETPFLVLKQVDVYTTIISGYEMEYTLKRKDTANEWVMTSEEDIVMGAIRDLTGKMPIGYISTLRELSPELMAAAWFMIFMDEIS